MKKNIMPLVFDCPRLFSFYLLALGFGFCYLIQTTFAQPALALAVLLGGFYFAWRMEMNPITEEN